MKIPWFVEGKKEDKKVAEQKVDDKKDDDKFEIKPAELKGKLDKIDGLETSLNELKTKSAVLDRMDVFLNEQKTAKDEAARRKAAEDRAKVQEQTDEDLDAEFLTDPANATRKILNESMRPLVESQVNTNARIVMNDMFTNSDEFEYAHDPTIRREVEINVAKLPLGSRTDPESIRNCYLVVEGRHKQEIKDGKIKARVSASASSGTGTGSPEGKGDVVVTLSEQEKKAAKVFGLSDADYAKTKKEMSYV